MYKPRAVREQSLPQAMAGGSPLTNRNDNQVFLAIEDYHYHHNSINAKINKTYWQMILRDKSLGEVAPGMEVGLGELNPNAHKKRLYMDDWDKDLVKAVDEDGRKSLFRDLWDKYKAGRNRSQIRLMFGGTSAGFVFVAASTALLQLLHPIDLIR